MSRGWGKIMWTTLEVAHAAKRWVTSQEVLEKAYGAPPHTASQREVVRRAIRRLDQLGHVKVRATKPLQFIEVPDRRDESGAAAYDRRRTEALAAGRPAPPFPPDQTIRKATPEEWDPYYLAVFGRPFRRRW